MSIIDRYLQHEQPALPADWQILENLEQLEDLHRESFDKPVVIFKHSHRCGTSHMAKHRLEQDWNFTPGEIGFFFVDVINHRPISNAIALQYGVVHHSPQIIVIHNGLAVYDTSHYRISVADLRAALNKPA